MIILADALENIATAIRTGALIFLGLIVFGILLWIIKVIVKIHRFRKKVK